MIESTYSVSSFSGLVSSKRRLVPPPNSSARPKSRQIALACPMCRYPLGSGGKRVHTRPPYLLLFRSSTMMSRTKLEGAVAVGVTASISGLGTFMTCFFASEDIKRFIYILPRASHLAQRRKQSSPGVFEAE